MATIAGASSSTITSILGTVAALATTTQRTINTAAASIDMLDTYVDSARNRQAKSTKLADERYLRNLLIEATAEQVLKEKQIFDQFKDPTLKTAFDTTFAKYEALFTEAQP